MKLPLAWMLRRAPPEASAVLDRKRIYILPTKQGLLLALMLFLMLTGSINYALSLGFLLTFLLASLALVSIYHAFSNLANLKLYPGKVAPVFAGEDARFRVNMEGGGRERRSIGILAGGIESFHDMEKGKTAAAGFDLKTGKRGWFQPGRFTVFTLYPLGLFRAWSYVELAMPCLVYPALSGAAVPGERREAVAGHDDFSGLRAYRPGDSLRHAAWKSLARGQGLQVKEFEELKNREILWLEWDKVGGDVEERLSRLARMTLDAHGEGRRFGLRLPGETILPGTGEPQKLRVLEALALFET